MRHMRWIFRPFSYCYSDVLKRKKRNIWSHVTSSLPMKIQHCDWTVGKTRYFWNKLSKKTGFYENCTVEWNHSYIAVVLFRTIELAQPII